MKPILMAATAIAAALAAAPAAAAYKCVDKKGMTHIGQTPPAACADVVMYEISRGGTVLRKIDPPPTPEELERRREEAERRKEEERAAAEQKRRDTTLLQTFTSEKEFDVARDRNLEPLRGRIRSAQDRIKAIDKRLEDIENEMEFYKAGKSAKAKEGQPVEPPRPMVEERERLRNEKANLTRAIAVHEQQMQSLAKRFEDDKQRWVTLKRGAAPQAAPVSAATK